MFLIILGIIDIILAIGVILFVMLQSGNSNLSGTIAGNTETFLGKNKGKRKDAFYSKITMYLAIAIVVVTLLMGALAIVQ